MFRKARSFVPRLALGIALFGAAFAHAGASGKSQHAEVTLISDASSIAAGKAFTVAVQWKLDKGWHTYWKDSGDSGMPPSVTWTLPPGFTAGELKFPKPEIYKTSAGTDYIFHDSVTLLVQITPPADLKAGTSVPIAAKVVWLECDKDACLPAKADLSTTLAVADAPVANQAEQFKQWQAKVAEGESFDPSKATTAK